MDQIKRAAGFYGTADSTYYVRPKGEVWVVQTDDLRECPFQIAELPDDATEADDLLTQEEADECIRMIGAAD